jgi:adenosylcobinamide kinase/adenosylcobinamide-phosphate guanylyltransferase
MKTLFIGGIKSGKSLHAERFTLKNSSLTPIYLATTEFFDEEMQDKVEKHKQQRENNFTTIEEALNIKQTIEKTNTYVLVECVSMWINNMLYHNHTKEQILRDIKDIMSMDKDIVFVLNDVSCSVVSDNKLVRDFVNINGEVSSIIAKACDEVYHITAGISVKIK